MLGLFLSNALIANEHRGHMSMAEKTDRGALVGETRNRVEIAKHIAPLTRRIERGVDDCEIVYPLL